MAELDRYETLRLRVGSVVESVAGSYGHTHFLGTPIKDVAGIALDIIVDLQDTTLANVFKLIQPHITGKSTDQNHEA